MSVNAVTHYLAITVSAHQDGTYVVRAIRRHPGSSHMLPSALDEGFILDTGAPAMAQILAEVAARLRDGLRDGSVIL